MNELSYTLMDGVAVNSEKIKIYFAANLSNDEREISRMVLFSDTDRWGKHNINTTIRSVDARLSPLEFYALGKNGNISICDVNHITFEKIPDAGTGNGKYGYVKRIKSIADQIYVCGDLHQVYKRENGLWRHIDDQILIHDLKTVGQALNDIAGTASDDIYTVGDGGAIFHYDGKHWKDTVSPTSCHLERILCVSKDEVYICGSNGVFLRGNYLSGWEILGDQDSLKEDFWGMAMFQGKLYLATPLRIVTWTGVDFEEVNISFESKGAFHRLSVSDSVLWSIGVHDLACFDGQQWEKMLILNSLN